ncbi:MAG: carboxyl transferase domain-containing protein [Gammaproteobacteria bacterium]|jgi:acetyl-CoA carboxylase carboxyltransferase component|nr:carboxyl transferase domain-containing protein [Gammaproteobacteria bacterium]MDP7153147.1 carboxyl transferase domain-containing protein [Gammaproteobacteria bacterium]MDP7455619.1 carboxyl transferase domain-containing protein [Gammaproteobacteria bacterium]HJO11135.1 carboxyl transferase domain-containing protein [Gammaproteobacteria bacterium]|tara:strand:+ start:1968 stop:3527 length:1560 start_codon:yes stop_codon:yes gene_type:complete
MSWKDEIEELRRREELAHRMGGSERIQRQHDNGRLTVRERIDLLLDTESFHEIGALAGRASYDDDGKLQDFTPSNFVLGTGRINGRRVVIGGDDFTVRGGAADAKVGNKSGYGEDYALEMRLPLIRLIDGSGGGGSVKTLEMVGHSYIPELRGFETTMKLMGHIPVVCACMGSVAGLGAVRTTISHFSLMVKGTSQLFVAGPPVVERGFGKPIEKNELGGSQIHANRSGVVDNEVESEAEAFATIKQFLSYLPQNVWQAPPRLEQNDYAKRRDEALLSVIPRDRRQMYQIREIINSVLDIESFFEISAGYGKALVTGLARLDGYSVGIMANDTCHHGGAVNAAASEKMMRFVDLCDTFHIPVVNLVDNPGFLIGSQAEEEGTARLGSRALMACYQATVPWVAIIIRRCYGVAGAGHGNSDRLNLRYAWPSADWGSLPIEGGVQAAYRRDIEAAEDPGARRRELEDMLEQYRSPFRTAEAFGIEEVIDPRDTRPILCDWVELAYELIPAQLGPKTRIPRP